MTQIQRPVICEDVIAYCSGAVDIQGDVVFEEGVYSPNEKVDFLDNPIRVEGELRIGGEAFYPMTK